MAMHVRSGTTLCRPLITTWTDQILLCMYEEREPRWLISRRFSSVIVLTLINKVNARPDAKYKVIYQWTLSLIILSVQEKKKNTITAHVIIWCAYYKRKTANRIVWKNPYKISRLSYDGAFSRDPNQPVITDLDPPYLTIYGLRLWQLYTL